MEVWVAQLSLFLVLKLFLDQALAIQVVICLDCFLWVAHIIHDPDEVC